MRYNRYYSVENLLKKVSDDFMEKGTNNVSSVRSAYSSKSS